MFEEFVGNVVKVVYKDTDSKGEKNKALSGKVISTSSGFVVLELNGGSLATIQISEIVSIIELRSGNYE
jgi:hypothetical protein